MHVRKSQRRKPERHCEDSTDLESTRKGKSVKLKKLRKRSLRHKTYKRSIFAFNVLELTFTRTISVDTSSSSAVKIQILQVLIAEKKRFDYVYHHIKTCHKGQAVYAEKLH